MIDEEKVVEETIEEEIKEETAEETVEETAEEAAEEKTEEQAEPEKKEEDEALEAKYMRLMADFQNYKRRTEREKQDVFAYANEKFALGIIEVIDNFERALEHKEEGAFADGMDLIYTQLIEVLKKNNVEEIEALGAEFDPNFHHAVLMEDSEEYKSNQVCAVLQKGYILNGKVIRPAMVKVAN